jgi:hypothetical protein
MLAKIDKRKDMKLMHPVIKSAMFNLIRTFELDISLATEDSFTLRIDIFQSFDDNKIYRYRAWRYEFFRMQSTFPQDSQGHGIHQPSDEIILVAFSLPKFAALQEFSSDDSKQAVRKVIENLGSALEHITSKKLHIEE